MFITGFGFKFTLFFVILVFQIITKLYKYETKESETLNLLELFRTENRLNLHVTTFQQDIFFLQI